MNLTVKFDLFGICLHVFVLKCQPLEFYGSNSIKLLSTHIWIITDRLTTTDHKFIADLIGLQSHLKTPIGQHIPECPESFVYNF